MKTSIVSSRVPGLVGDSHRYSNGRGGEISLVHPCQMTFEAFEIYCIEGDLFEDIERFDSLAEAEARIIELLEGTCDTANQ